MQVKVLRLKIVLFLNISVTTEYFLFCVSTGIWKGRICFIFILNSQTDTLYFWLRYISRLKIYSSLVLHYDLIHSRVETETVQYKLKDKRKKKVLI